MAKSTAILRDPIIAFHRVYVDITGSITAALMLSQAVYWTPRTDDRAGWFYKTQKDWQQETGLTPKEQRSARQKLTSLGILEEALEGVPAQLHYRVDMDILGQLIDEKLDVPKGNSQMCPKVTTRSDERAHLTYTETTPETTPETTDISCDDAQTPFATFWDAYGNKVNRPLSERSFAKAIKKTDIATMLSAIEAQRRSRKWQEGYQPNPSTWLNGEGWNDDLPAAESRARYPHEGQTTAQRLAEQARRERAEYEQARGDRSDGSNGDGLAGEENHGRNEPGLFLVAGRRTG